MEERRCEAYEHAGTPGELVSGYASRPGQQRGRSREGSIARGIFDTRNLDHHHGAQVCNIGTDYQGDRFVTFASPSNVKETDL